MVFIPHQYISSKYINASYPCKRFIYLSNGFKEVGIYCEFCTYQEITAAFTRKQHLYSKNEGIFILCFIEKLLLKKN